jgi:hypothetical protein
MRISREHTGRWRTCDGERKTPAAASRGRESPGQGRGKIDLVNADRQGEKGLRGVRKGVCSALLIVKNM